MLLWLNLLFLRCVVLIPFSTAFLGKYWAFDSGQTQARVPILVYAGNLIVAGLLLEAVWLYAQSKEWFVDWLYKPEDQYQIGRTSWRNALIPFLCIVAVFVCFFE